MSIPSNISAWDEPLFQSLMGKHQIYLYTLLIVMPPFRKFKNHSLASSFDDSFLFLFVFSIYSALQSYESSSQQSCRLL